MPSVAGLGRLEQHPLTQVASRASPGRGRTRVGKLSAGTMQEDCEATALLAQGITPAWILSLPAGDRTARGEQDGDSQEAGLGRGDPPGLAPGSAELGKAGESQDMAERWRGNLLRGRQGTSPPWGVGVGDTDQTTVPAGNCVKTTTYECADCKKSFSCKTHLTRHQKTHATEKPRKCPGCGKACGSSPSLLLHQSSCKSEKPYKCLDCGESFGQSSGLIRHWRVHTGEKAYCCLVCGKRYARRPDLLKHQRVHPAEVPRDGVASEGETRIPKQEISGEEEERGTLPGGIREDTLQGQETKNQHRRERQQGSQRGMLQNRFTLRGGSLDAGNETAGQAQVRAKERVYACTECGKTFNWRYSLYRHKRTHTGERPYECPECWKTFSDHSNFISHQKNHRGEKPYKCLDCGKSFGQSTTLLSHQRSHTGEKPYFCSDCGKHFARRQNLVDHQSIHTGERPYGCPDCGRRFRRNTDLIYHQRIHTGERPYKCPACGKGFTCRSKMNEHQRTHTGEAPYQCSVCGKRYKAKVSLTSHLKLHTG